MVMFLSRLLLHIVKRMLYIIFLLEVRNMKIKASLVETKFLGSFGGEQHRFLTLYRFKSTTGLVPIINTVR